MSNTGFCTATRRIIITRADFWCERCGGQLGVEAHHRRPRGAGGTNRESTNTASNGLWLCRGCHDRIEAHRAEAREFGWLVRQTEEPREVPVLYRGSLVILDDLGGLEDYPGAGMVTA